MKIHVKYFASVRDLMETDAEDLNIATSLSVYELWKQLTVKINAVSYTHLTLPTKRIV